MPTEKTPRTKSSGGAADRLQQMYADQIQLADAAEKDWKAEQKHRADADAAHERFREKVAVLADQGLESDRIAFLVGVPEKVIRSARSGRRGSSRGKGPASVGTTPEDYVADARKRMTDAGEDPDREVTAQDARASVAPDPDQIHPIGEPVPVS